MALHLFTDGSSDPRTKIGYGAALVVEEVVTSSQHELAECIQTRRFAPATSSALELECLLWALEELVDKGQRVVVCTDSQLLVGLESRRETLEGNSYLSAQGKPHRLAGLYRRFFQLIDGMDVQLVKLEGHKRGSEKTASDRLFTLVDRASRSALRKELRNPASPAVEQGQHVKEDNREV